MTRDAAMLTAAAARSVVHIDDDRGGRTGRLWYWPANRPGRRRGTRAVVELRPGVFVSVDPNQVHMFGEQEVNT